jgi:hypothetical protein
VRSLAVGCEVRWPVSASWGPVWDGWLLYTAAVLLVARLVRALGRSAIARYRLVVVIVMRGEAGTTPRAVPDRNEPFRVTACGRSVVDGAKALSWCAGKAPIQIPRTASLEAVRLEERKLHRACRVGNKVSVVVEAEC